MTTGSQDFVRAIWSLQYACYLPELGGPKRSLICQVDQEGGAIGPTSPHP